MSEDINVNVKGADEILAATKAAEAERIRLAAQQAMGASGTGGLGGLGGNNFTSGQYQRYVDAYQRSKAGRANLDAVDRLRAQRNMAGAVARGEASWIIDSPNRGYAAERGYTSRAMQRYQDLVMGKNSPMGSGTAGPSPGAGISGGGSRGPFDPPGSSDEVAWHKQPGIGTNKSWGGVTTPGGGFGKSQVGFLPTSSAKARGAVNIAKSVGKGGLPAAARSSLVLWAAQEAALAYKEFAQGSWKGPMNNLAPTASAEEHSAAFLRHVQVNFKPAMYNMAQTGLAIGGVAASIQGAVFAPLGSLFGVDTFGITQRGYHRASNMLEKFYTGSDAQTRALEDFSKETKAMEAATRRADASADKYIAQFADRNADELAALGFGASDQARKLVEGSAAARQLRENLRAKLSGKEDDELVYDTSDGDD